MTHSRASVKRIRAVPSETPEPLSIDDLQKTGNALATELRKEAVQAIRVSANGIYLGRSYTPSDLRQMQRQAQEAADAWQQVGSIAAELLDQWQRAKEAHQ